jgi:uncharacterized protein
MAIPLLSFLFALVAIVYASVGFGGGSTYTALLAVSGIDYRFVPIIALLCNIIVVTGGTARFVAAGLLDWRKVLPLILVSAPLAFLGGQFPLKEAVFYMLLGGMLLASSAALFIPVSRLPDWRLPMPFLLCLSAVVGLLAGLSGIGGGIFMAPLLHLVRWAEARRIAAFASIYILINSIAGVAGQITKADSPKIDLIASEYWPLMLAVLVGGQLGSVIGLRLVPPAYLRWITAALVGYVAARLLWQGLNLSH